jgi:hypothetical protein
VSALISHHGSRSISRCKSIVIGATAATAALFGAGAWQNAKASPFTLQDGNSSVTINPTSPSGVSNWSVNGQNQINTEWFWYRTGSSGGQQSLDTLGTPTVEEIDEKSDGENDFALVTYPAKNGIQVTLEFTLSGGLAASETSDLLDSVIISNQNSSPVNYHFFEYGNFNLGGETTGQTVTIADGDTATDIGNGHEVQVMANSGIPSEYEASLFPSQFNSVSSTSSPATLSDVSSAGPGDGEEGFEWDATIGANKSLVVAIDNDMSGESIQSVPEPTSAIAVLGLSGVCLTRPRRRDDDGDPRTAQVTEA